MSEPILITEKPSPAEYADLRLVAGWGAIDAETAKLTVDNAVFTACLRVNQRLLGIARVVGDGALYFYISDVIVHPELRGAGHGAQLMAAVVKYLADNAKPNATIALLPIKGREAFYEKFGFRRCPNDLLGPGLYLPDPRRV